MCDEKRQLPQEFVEEMKQLLGQEWMAFIDSYEHEKYQGLRFNPLKPGMSEQKEQQLVHQLTVEPVAWAHHGFYYEEQTRPGKHPYHEMGVYYIQEPSAMSAAAMLAPKQGMRVLDLCAAPGGKTTQLASYLGQKGLLWSNEIHPARCKILSSNVERMGIKNAIVSNEDSGRLAAKLPAYFHAVLVDAPCSGEGMFRKNPAALEEWSVDNVKLCAQRQREILHNAATMLMPGGTMVYSTCTFSPAENEENMAWFLQEHPEFSIQETDAPWFSKGYTQFGENMDKTFRLWPHKLHGEGHFVAVLRKTGILPEYDKKPHKGKPFKGLDKEKETALKEFLDKNITKEVADWILDGPLALFGDQLYRLPETDIPLNGIRVLRAGLHIGEFKKKRLEPAFAFAMALGKENVQNWVDLGVDDKRAIGYFLGESIFLMEEDSFQGKNGWCLVTMDGFSAGWGKLDRGQIKNHYPKGLRRQL